MDFETIMPNTNVEFEKLYEKLKEIYPQVSRYDEKEFGRESHAASMVFETTLDTDVDFEKLCAKMKGNHPLIMASVGDYWHQSSSFEKLYQSLVQGPKEVLHVAARPQKSPSIEHKVEKHPTVPETATPSSGSSDKGFFWGGWSKLPAFLAKRYTKAKRPGSILLISMSALSRQGLRAGPRSEGIIVARYRRPRRGAISRKKRGEEVPTRSNMGEMDALIKRIEHHQAAIAAARRSRKRKKQPAAHPGATQAPRAPPCSGGGTPVVAAAASDRRPPGAVPASPPPRAAAASAETKAAAAAGARAREGQIGPPPLLRNVTAAELWGRGRRPGARRPPVAVGAPTEAFRALFARAGEPGRAGPPAEGRRGGAAGGGAGTGAREGDAGGGRQGGAVGEGGPLLAAAAEKKGNRAGAPGSSQGGGLAPGLLPSAGLLDRTAVAAGNGACGEVLPAVGGSVGVRVVPPPPKPPCQNSAGRHNTGHGDTTSNQPAGGCSGGTVVNSIPSKGLTQMKHNKAKANHTGAHIVVNVQGLVTSSMPRQLQPDNAGALGQQVATVVDLTSSNSAPEPVANNHDLNQGGDDWDPFELFGTVANPKYPKIVLPNRADCDLKDSRTREEDSFWGSGYELPLPPYTTF